MQTFNQISICDYPCDSGKIHIFYFMAFDSTLVIPEAMFGDHFVNVPSQWETTLQCNVASHWLGAYTKWSLHVWATNAFINIIWTTPVLSKLDSFINTLSSVIYIYIYIYTRWCHDMEMLIALLPIVNGSLSVCQVLIFLCISHEATVEQMDELPVIWYTMTPMWRHSSPEGVHLRLIWEWKSYVIAEISRLFMCNLFHQLCMLN